MGRYPRKIANPSGSQQIIGHRRQSTENICLAKFFGQSFFVSKTVLETNANGTALNQMPDRRAVVLEHWATRADNIAGHMVCQAIEDWLMGTVIYSEHPITAEEYAEYEAKRTDGRRLPRPQ